MTNYSQRYASGDSNTAGAFYFDTISAVDYPASKVLWGAEGAVNHASAATPLPVTAVITGDALTALQLIDNAVSGAGFNVTQLGGASVPIGAGVEATALRVTIATDSTGVLSVDDNGGSITVDGTVAVSGTVTVGTHAVTQSGAWTVDLGATDNAVLDAIAASVAGTLTVGLPTGASTSALQTTGNSSLASIDGKLPALGQALAAASVPIVLTAAQLTTLTPLATVAATQSGTWTVQPGNTANTTAWLVTGTGGTFPVTDSGGSITIDNAALAVTGGGVEASALRVTLANDSTGVLSIDDNGGSITVDGTFWQATQPVSIAATVTVTGAGGTFPITDSGGSLTVDNNGTFAVQATLQAGTAYAGKVRLTDGTTDAEVVPLTGYNAQAVAIVDAAGDQITSFGGGTQYTEGDADASVTGTAVMWEDAADTLRVVSAATPLPIGDAGGSLTVDGTVSVSGSVAVTGTFWQATQPVSLASVPSHDVTNAGTFAVQAAQSGTWTVTGAGGTFPVTDSGGSLTVDNAALSVVGGGTEATALRVTLANDSTGLVSVDDGGGSVTVDGTVAATQSGAWSVTDISGTVSLPTGAATAANQSTLIGHVDGIEALLTTIDADASTLAVVGNGAAATALRVSLANDSTGIVALTTSTASIGKLAANTGVTIGAVEIAAAQTLATVTTVSTVTTCSTVTTLTGGGVAHDAADSGNPVKVGARATASLAGATLVAAADRSDLLCGTDGALVVRNNYSLEDVVQERATNTDGASTAFASGLAAPGAGVRLWITSVTIANSSASFCTVDLRDGAAGSVLWTLPVPATGGVTFRFDPPLKLTANTALAFDASAAITTLSISANGFKSKV